MKGPFPRDCLISAYLHLLAKRGHGRTDAEVHGLTGALQTAETSALPVEHGPPSVRPVQAYMDVIFFLILIHGYSVS